MIEYKIIKESLFYIIIDSFLKNKKKIENRKIK